MFPDKTKIIVLFPLYGLEKIAKLRNLKAPIFRLSPASTQKRARQHIKMKDLDLPKKILDILRHFKKKTTEKILAYGEFLFHKLFLRRKQVTRTRKFKKRFWLSYIKKYA
ncbi:unnamed protein product, partial [Larinioides sclopetarius]